MSSKSRSWAEELRAWRAKRGYTQVQAAEHLLVPVNTLQEWEQDRAEPPHKGPLRVLMSMDRDGEVA